jgi:hypothetical protein
MDHDLLVIALKVAGALLGGVLGVIGVLFNFKRSDDHLTGWGIVVIVGIVASAAAGVFSSIVEGYKARSEAVVQSQRTETLLRELSRAIQPITQLEITYWASIPSDAPGMRGYVDRIAKAIKADQAQLTRVEFLNDKAIDKAIHATASGKNDELLTVDLGLHSRLWPQAKEPPVGTVALGFSLNVFIKKKPVPPQQFWPVISTDSPENADWIAMSFPNTKRRNRLQFNLQTKTVEIFGRAVFPKGLWHSNGKITSTVDLYGAQLILLPMKYACQSSNYRCMVVVLVRSVVDSCTSPNQSKKLVLQTSMVEQDNLPRIQSWCESFIGLMSGQFRKNRRDAVLCKGAGECIVREPVERQPIGAVRLYGLGKELHGLQWIEWGRRLLIHH